MAENELVGPAVEVLEEETVLAPSVSVTLPSEHPVTVTVKVVPEVTLGDAEHPVAVPENEKSPLARPSIDAANVNVSVWLAAEVVEDPGEKEDTEGATEYPEIVAQPR